VGSVLELELKAYIDRLDFLKEELGLVNDDDLNDVLDEISEIKICIKEIKEEIEQQKLLEKEFLKKEKK
jgi:uncharacterized protein (UPF0335 family)